MALSYRVQKLQAPTGSGGCSSVTVSPEGVFTVLAVKPSPDGRGDFCTRAVADFFQEEYLSSEGSP